MIFTFRKIIHRWEHRKISPELTYISVTKLRELSVEPEEELNQRNKISTLKFCSPFSIFVMSIKEENWGSEKKMRKIKKRSNEDVEEATTVLVVSTI